MARGPVLLSLTELVFATGAGIAIFLLAFAEPSVVKLVSLDLLLLCLAAIMVEGSLEQNSGLTRWRRGFKVWRTRPVLWIIARPTPRVPALIGSLMAIRIVGGLSVAPNHADFAGVILWWMVPLALGVLVTYSYRLMAKEHGWRPFRESVVQSMTDGRTGARVT